MGLNFNSMDGSSYLLAQILDIEYTIDDRKLLLSTLHCKLYWKYNENKTLCHTYILNKFVQMNFFSLQFLYIYNIVKTKIHYIKNQKKKKKKKKNCSTGWLVGLAWLPKRPIGFNQNSTKSYSHCKTICSAVSIWRYPEKAILPLFHLKPHYTLQGIHCCYLMARCWALFFPSGFKGKIHYCGCTYPLFQS